MRIVLDLLLPPACAGCGLEGRALCGRCGTWLARRLDQPPGIPLGMPGGPPDHLVELEWCAAFSGPVREALHALKYRAERRLAEPLGSALADRWRAARMGGELAVHVPVHPARRRERGFDQAEDLARACARQLGLPAVPALARVAQTAAMHDLGRDARARNVGGAFAVPDRWRGVVAGRWVVLIDDIVTTGATLSGCAAALEAAGALAVSGLTVARER